ncbi:MAG: transglycosylase domain-containing protein [Acidimicrobiales bacterium]
MVGHASTSMRPRRRRSLGYRGARLLVKAAVVIALCAVVIPPAAAAVGLSTLLFADLPGNLPDEKPRVEALPSQMFDADGNLIAVFREFELTVPAKASDVPQVMKDAVVAIEDRRFWNHKGVDAAGIARAARENWDAGEIRQGGSTITQQYVKNVYLSTERSADRKLREAIIATQLERRMSKEEILFRYLDTTYFGAGAYGVAAAAKVYFDKPLGELTPSEAATIAGIIPAPTRWSPRESVEEAEKRRRLVLDKMLEEGYLDAGQHAEAVQQVLWNSSDGEPPGPATRLAPIQKRGALAFPFFVDYVERELLDTIGPERLYRGGLRIETTISPHLQGLAEDSVNNRLAGTEAPLEMSLVSVEPATGQVKAMVGGRDYAQSQVNLATGGSTGFQPGSSFKTVVLAAALEKGIRPEDVYDAPGSYSFPGCRRDDCTVSNYDENPKGRITVRKATEGSVNTVYAQLIFDAGIAESVDMAIRLGVPLDPNKKYGPSLTLGAYETSPLHMAAAYATLANHGKKLPVTGIAKVLDKNGGALIDNTGRQGEQVVSAPVADTVTDILRGVVTKGTGKRADLGRPVAGKTGTAQAYRAAWFVGYTPQLSTAVWMGYSDAQRSLIGVRGVYRVTGGSHPAIAFHDFMAPALKGEPTMEFQAPAPLPRSRGEVPLAVDAAVVEEERVGARPQANPLETPTDCDGPCLVVGKPAAPDYGRLAPPPVAPPPVVSPSGPPPSASANPSASGSNASASPPPAPAKAPPPTPTTTKKG